MELKDLRWIFIEMAGCDFLAYEETAASKNPWRSICVPNLMFDINMFFFDCLDLLRDKYDLGFRIMFRMNLGPHPDLRCF